ncbi:cytochrome c [Afifella sp. JA880]|uniref:c-type cytochrome n=1 Tax=Afifella sp. JA880 TaxID=2975280 RepID=UPI0021BB8DD8|nr:cytochrome c [Afifella sp. JA880]MCT8267901.1 cytochrome c [Afifella sp. JA880]
MRWLAILPALLLLAGCQEQEMAKQPKLKTYAFAEAFAGHSAARPLPEGVVARSDPVDAQQALAPPKPTLALVQRGRERFEIFCAPCHGYGGYGDGMIVERGFPQPPSFHSDRLRATSAQHIFDVITNGYGVMYSYGDRVPPKDRWAIALYLRALQVSQMQEGGGP